MERAVSVQREVGLSGTALKMVALVTMLLDHIHYFLGIQVWCRSGSAWQEELVDRYFYSAWWRDLPIPEAERNIFSEFMVLRWEWD